MYHIHKISHDIDAPNLLLMWITKSNPGEKHRVLDILLAYWVNYCPHRKETSAVSVWTYLKKRNTIREQKQTENITPLFPKHEHKTPLWRELMPLIILKITSSTYKYQVIILCGKFIQQRKADFLRLRVSPNEFMNEYYTLYKLSNNKQIYKIRNV